MKKCLVEYNKGTNEAMHTNKIPLIIVSGPTASGKTGLGIKLSQIFSGEVISADSMQIYKNMPIATAQPDSEEMDGIPHHLMGFIESGNDFSVADYTSLAHKKIEEIYSRGKMPIIVGGTGLYINSLVDNINFLELDSEEVRQKLIKELDEYGIDYMYEKLKSLDIEAAKKIEKNNTRRVIRALEVCITTGKTFSQINKESKPDESRYNVLWFNITFNNRQNLYERINKRVEIMAQNGIIEEAKKMRQIISNFGAGQAIGHKELYPYLDGEITLSEALDNLKTKTRQYAKRQITWFKKRNDTISLVSDSEDILEKAQNIIKDWMCENERQ